MEIQELKDKLSKISLNRFVWKPITDINTSEKSISKFSGIPILLNDEEWPCCSICKNKMPLIIQIDLSELPIKDFGNNGILQVFFCLNMNTNCDIDDSMYTKEPKNQLCRIIDLQKGIKRNNLKEINDITTKYIIDWEYLGFEYPCYPEEVSINLTELEIDKLYDLFHETYSKDKLFGWPLWIQYPFYPICSICEKEMKYILQISSEDNFDHNFGDGGNGYLVQCQEHKSIMSFYTFSS